MVHIISSADVAKHTLAVLGKSHQGAYWDRESQPFSAALEKALEIKGISGEWLRAAGIVYHPSNAATARPIESEEVILGRVNLAKMAGFIPEPTDGIHRETHEDVTYARWVDTFKPEEVLREPLPRDAVLLLEGEKRTYSVIPLGDKHTLAAYTTSGYKKGGGDKIHVMALQNVEQFTGNRYGTYGTVSDIYKHTLVGVQQELGRQGITSQLSFPNVRTGTTTSPKGESYVEPVMEPGGAILTIDVPKEQIKDGVPTREYLAEVTQRIAAYTANLGKRAETKASAAAVSI